MINFNQDSYGELFRVNFGEDVSGANSYSMAFQPESGEVVEKSVSLGLIDVVVGDQQFLANQYAEYTTEQDVFDEYAGRWRVKAVAAFNDRQVATDWILFRVME